MERERTEPQLSKEQALAFAESGAWKDMTPIERGAFQLRQRLLCMPFDKFHEGLEALLGRPVFTHELGLNYDGLIAEAEGRADAPTFEQIINMIPKDKLVVVKV